MNNEQEGINLEEVIANTGEGIELPVIDNEENNLEDTNNNASENVVEQDNQVTDSQSLQGDDQKANLQKGVNYERKLRKAAEKENKELKEQLAKLAQNQDNTPEKNTLDELLESGVDLTIAKSISAAIDKKNKSSEQIKQELSDVKFKLELSEKSKESSFSDILEHEDEIKSLVDKGLTIEQAYYAVNYPNAIQNTNKEIEKKIEAKIQNNQTRKNILGNVNSNAGNAIQDSENKPKATAEEIAICKMAGIDIKDYLAAKNSDSINQYNNYNKRKVK